MRGGSTERGIALATNLYAVLKKRGSPIPLTLHARLEALGVDISILERRYGV